MRGELRVRGLVRGGLLLAMVSLVAACGSARQATEDDGHSHDHGDAAHVNDNLPHAGLAQLGRASELVVFGHVVAVVDGVYFGSDTKAGHTVVTLAVDEALKGDAGANTVDVVMLTHLGGKPVVIAGRPTPKVDDRGIWMLQPIAPEFNRKGYVLTNQNSQILAGEDGLTGGDALSPSAKEVEQLGDLPSVLERLRAVAT